MSYAPRKMGWLTAWAAALCIGLGLSTAHYLDDGKTDTDQSPEGRRAAMAAKAELLKHPNGQRTRKDVQLADKARP